MAINERIRHIRKFRGMTLKRLGMDIGFGEKTADIRMAQYESGVRKPKKSLVNSIAGALKVSPQALDVPNIDSCVGLAHTLFALEDIYGVRIGEIDGELCLRLDISKGVAYHFMHHIFSAWHHEAEKLKNGSISKEDYDAWRYNYPRTKAERARAKSEDQRFNMSKNT